MQFGMELWDQWKEVEDYVTDGVHSMQSLNDFMKRRAEIEAEYSKSLQKLVKPFKDELAKKAADKKATPRSKAISDSTMTQAWASILAEAESLAEIHHQVSEKVDTDLRKSIKHQAQENEKKIKDRFDEIRKANLELQKQITLLEKHREKFESDKKSMEAARLLHEKVSKNPKSTEKEIDAAKVDAEKKALAASDSMEKYQQLIAETNEKKNKHYQQILPTVLNDVQTDDENFRIRSTRVALIKYQELLSSILPSISDSVEKMGGSFQRISAEQDSELFINLARTGDLLPPDYAFEEKASAKDVTAKRPGSARTMARTASESTDKEDDDSTILNMPPKKGRKLAADRVKAIEKETADVEKKKQAVESLLNVYHHKTAKDPKNLEDLTTQKSQLETRLDNLGLKKHKLLCHIATIDKQPQPELPSHLVGKSLTSPASPFFDNNSSSGTMVRSPLSGNNPDVGGNSSSGGGGSGDVVCRVKMLYDFEAAPGSQELSVAADVVLEITEIQDDGWWKGRYNVNGEWKEGYIPGNYTEAI
ncbi:Formin-binding protein 1 [Blyttiomyces sp. JEL0837]|nr:Formin-binding protein 1 [Blyttiomyces sp. JEL0837]